MKERNIVALLLLTVVTFGIYAIYWSVSTKIELNKRGATIPTAWLIIVPIVNIWWMWKYSEAVDSETNGALSTVIAFLLLFLLGVIGMMIIQHEFNKGGSPVVATPDAEGAIPAAPVVDAAPEAPVAVAAVDAAPAPVVDTAPEVAATEPTAPETIAPAPAESFAVAPEQAPTTPVTVNVITPSTEAPEGSPADTSETPSEEPSRPTTPVA